MKERQIYFSDDVAVLPGDGQVVLLGDARAEWNIMIVRIISPK